MEKLPVQRINVLGVPIDCILPENLESVLETLCEQELNQRIIFVDLALIFRARKNTEWMNFISEAALVLPTNKTITKAIHFLYNKQAQAYIPLDLILQLMTILERKSGTAYLLGSRPSVLQIADLNLRGTYPGLQFVGRHAGYYQKKHEDVILSAIRKASPSLLICSRGLKGREMWLYQNGPTLNANILIYSKDSFDIFANKKPRPSTQGPSGGELVVSYLIKPWKLLLFFRYLIFQMMLVFQRIKIRKSG
ncbi:MAG: WecB/TagA/CpsF family glycosyltransferase [Spirochaetia bacterium]